MFVGLYTECIAKMRMTCLDIVNNDYIINVSVSDPEMTWSGGNDFGSDR